MDNFVYDVNKEYKDVIDKVSEKFGYSDDLKSVLTKILPAMLATASYEEKELFYKMLSHTPIATIFEERGDTVKAAKDKYIGNPNPHIKEVEKDNGEYGSKEGDGAFCTEPILDENLNLLGIKQFLYVKAFDLAKPMSNSRKNFFEKFGTGINVHHLIHELGHAWCSELNPYTFENGILTQRTGTAELKFKVEKLEDGTYSKEQISQDGLMIEEGMNTNMEEEALQRYLNINADELKNLYRDTIIPSNYRGLLSNMTDHLSQKTSKNLTRRWRIFGDASAKDRLNSAMEKTEEYAHRSDMLEDRKRKAELFNDPQKEALESLFKRRHDEFFPDKSNMSGINIIDNVLLQCFNIKSNQMAFMGRKNGLEYYGEIVKLISADGYYLINQTPEKLKELDEQNVSK